MSTRHSVSVEIDICKYEKKYNDDSFRGNKMNPDRNPYSTSYEGYPQHPPPQGQFKD